MTSSTFVSLLDDATRDSFECVADVGLREWSASGSYAATNDGRVHLLYLLDGILACNQSKQLTRVLPREVLRVGNDAEQTLTNPSRSDTTKALHIVLVPSNNASLSTRHHYFSDDEKDNKLCKVAACSKEGRTLATGAQVDIGLTTLGKYDTLLLDRASDQSLMIVCARGKATVNTEAVSAGNNAISIDTQTATVVGMQPCTLLTIRGQTRRKQA